MNLTYGHDRYCMSNPGSSMSAPVENVTLPEYIGLFLSQILKKRKAKIRFLCSMWNETRIPCPTQFFLPIRIPASDQWWEKTIKKTYLARRTSTCQSTCRFGARRVRHFVRQERAGLAAIKKSKKIEKKISRRYFWSSTFHTFHILHASRTFVFFSNSFREN